MDVTGMLCPMPVLRARRKLDELAVGQLLLVTASDPAVVHDMPAFCRMAGHRLIMAHSEEGRYLFEIEKGEPAPEADNTEEA
ncbi:MAG: sulfurtransferase TusA family protein [Alphaproteobacteria bacterium]|nr:MAG: sulfurtransferase TusA family protein [Alphaproteobacteria bacterium]